MSTFDPVTSQREREFEESIRPRTFEQFIGQQAVKERLVVYVTAARERREALDHVLLTGFPGLGKTTLAGIIAAEMGSVFKETSAPAITRAGDLVGTLTSLEEGDVLFIDEIHRLSPAVEEYLYQAIEDFSIDLVLDNDTNARSVRLPLQRFTLIGATTREGLLTKPLRDRFGILQKLDPYPDDELVDIVGRTARLLTVDVSPEAARALAGRARGTPRVVNRLLRRVRDLAQVRGLDVIDEGVVLDTMRMEMIDEFGLEETDRRILKTLHRTARPLGIKTLAASVGEAEDTVETVYEPHLLRKGLLIRSPRGREITEAGCRAIGIEPGPGTGQKQLFG